MKTDRPVVPQHAASAGRPSSEAAAETLPPSHPLFGVRTLLQKERKLLNPMNAGIEHCALEEEVIRLDTPGNLSTARGWSRASTAEVERSGTAGSRPETPWICTGLEAGDLSAGSVRAASPASRCHRLAQSSRVMTSQIGAGAARDAGRSGGEDQANKPATAERSKTPYVPQATSNVSFHLSKKLQAAFDAVLAQQNAAQEQNANVADAQEAPETKAEPVKKKTMSFSRHRDAEVEAENRRRQEEEAEKKRQAAAPKFIDVSTFSEFLDQARIQYTADEVEKITAQVLHECEHKSRANGRLLSFDDCVMIITSPNYSLCLHIEEMVSKDRRDMIKKFLKGIMELDEAERIALLQAPPTQLLGDKQAVRLLALEVQNQSHPEPMRVNLVRGLAAIAEKPREVSGQQPPEGHKRNMMVDAKAIAALIFPLALGETIFLDQRSFFNPEPRPKGGGMVGTIADPSEDPPIGVGLTQAALDWHERAAQVRRPLQLHEAVPTDYCSRPEYYVAFKRVVHEPSDAVRVECIKSVTKLGSHETEHIVKALLNSVAHDPAWAVRAAAVEELGNMARELRKLGFRTRWGEARFWWAEDQAPWRPTRECFRKYFWDVLHGATRDLAWQVGARASLTPVESRHFVPLTPAAHSRVLQLAWQVRKRALETVADAVVFGDQVPYDWIVACAEDGAGIVKSTAQKLLMAALFGRGSLVSERNAKLLEQLEEGVSPEDAVLAADAHAFAVKEADADYVVIAALISRAKSESAMSRRQALQTLADTCCNARTRGDNAAILCLIDALQDADVLVRTAAINSLRKMALRGDERVLKALMHTALMDTEWQTRKAAIEAIEIVAVQGDTSVIAVLQDLSRDKNAWIREAAVKAIEIVALEADASSIQTVTTNLQDTAWEVRRAAARTLMLLETEGDGQDTVAPKVFGKEDKAWYRNVEGFLRKPLFMPLR